MTLKLTLISVEPGRAVKPSVSMTAAKSLVLRGLSFTLGIWRSNTLRMPVPAALEVKVFVSPIGFGAKRIDLR